jgi:hypothetical protein
MGVSAEMVRYLLCCVRILPVLTVGWYRNHALYALFPLISTDVLTPFIDLMEDALLQQVPPIVVSPRFK